MVVGAAPGTPVQPPPGPTVGGPGSGSRGPQGGGGWELVTWTLAAGKGAGGRRPVLGSPRSGGVLPRPPAWSLDLGGP